MFTIFRLAGRQGRLSGTAACLILAALLCLPPSLSGAPQSAGETAERRPLLQPGKKTLYQRVISHPGARLHTGPEDDAAPLPNQVQTFTAFYVYGREGNRLEAGVSTTGPDGWIDTDKVTEWPQAITMLFTERTSRMPVLFFRDHASLVSACTDEDLAGRMAGYRAAAETGRMRGEGGTGQEDPSFPVIAMEPPDKEGAVSRDRFYLMPVLNMDNQFEAAKLIEVASIDPGLDPMDPAGSGKAGQTPPAELRTAIAFVIDTTISMRPYIEQSLRVVRDIYNQLEQSPNGDKMAFAVVAYRNNVTLTPGLEYSSKVISDFKTVRDRASLEKALAAVREASVSSHSVDEDAMNGVKTAADKLSWEGYSSRVMLLVSDAGALKGSDPHAATGMDPAEMADYLRANRIWPTVLHIKSPKNRANHAPAEQAYRTLSRLSDGNASYIPINASTSAAGAAAFDKAGKALADSYSQLAEATAAGKLLTKPAALALSSDPEQRARQLGEIIGYAMQLEFLGANRRTKAPSVVRAWIADADLEKLGATPPVQVMAVEPAVLLTKNQLSDLAAQVKLLIDQATRAQRLGGSDFFQNLVSVAAQITRDPSRFSYSPGQNLARTGVLAEFLEGLPYKSDVLGMTEDEWYNKSVGEQTQFINRLKSRLARYEEYDKDRANWESFGSPNAGDWVYRVPLSMLP